jgi:hypothetical protein
MTQSHPSLTSNQTQPKDMFDLETMLDQMEPSLFLGMERHSSCLIGVIEWSHGATEPAILLACPSARCLRPRFASTTSRQQAPYQHRAQLVRAYLQLATCWR